MKKKTDRSIGEKVSDFLDSLHSKVKIDGLEINPENSVRGKELKALSESSRAVQASADDVAKQGIEKLKKRFGAK